MLSRHLPPLFALVFSHARQPQGYSTSATLESLSSSTGLLSGLRGVNSHRATCRGSSSFHSAGILVKFTPSDFCGSWGDDMRRRVDDCDGWQLKSFSICTSPSRLRCLILPFHSCSLPLLLSFLPSHRCPTLLLYIHDCSRCRALDAPSCSQRI